MAEKKPKAEKVKYSTETFHQSAAIKRMTPSPMILRDYAGEITHPKFGKVGMSTAIGNRTVCFEFDDCYYLIGLKELAEAVFEIHENHAVVAP